MLLIIAHLLEFCLIGYIGGICISDTLDAWGPHQPPGSPQ
jgi:hypothetical protein